MAGHLTNSERNALNTHDRIMENAGVSPPRHRGAGMLPTDIESLQKSFLLNLNTLSERGKEFARIVIGLAVYRNKIYNFVLNGQFESAHEHAVDMFNMYDKAITFPTADGRPSIRSALVTLNSQHQKHERDKRDVLELLSGNGSDGFVRTITAENVHCGLDRILDRLSPLLFCFKEDQRLHAGEHVVMASFADRAMRVPTRL